MFQLVDLKRFYPLDTADTLVHGAKEGTDALVGGVADSVGIALDVKDAIAQGIIGKEQSQTTSIKSP